MQQSPKQNSKLSSIESGSPTIRIDCKGIADAIQALKQFLIEAWHKVRHKRTEELIERNSALLSTLAVVQAIEEKRANGILVAEDAENLKRTLIDSALGLFECNALPTEVRPIETVHNSKLLSTFSPKLLGTGEPIKAEGKDGTPEPEPGDIKPRRPRRRRKPPEDVEGIDFHITHE